MQKIKNQIFIFTLLLLPTFDAIFSDSMELFQKLIAAIPIGISLCSFGTKKIIHDRYLILLVSALVITYIISFFFTGGGLKYAIYIIASFLVYIFFVENVLSDKDLTCVVSFSVIFMALIVSMYLTTGIDSPKNTIGSNLVVLSIIVSVTLFIKNGSITAIVLLNFFMVQFYLMLDFRGGVIHSIIIFLGFAFYKLSFLKLTWKSVLFTALLFEFVLIFGMTNLELIYSSFDVLSTVTDISHRGLESGRQLIWPLALELIYEKPIFGHGGGFLINQIFVEEFWSSHNLFLQVAMQTGIVGLAMLMMIFKELLIKMSCIHHRREFTFFASVWFSIFVFNSLEVAFFQNSMPIGMMQWAILAISMNRVRCRINV